VSYCDKCLRHFREPEGEEGDHGCPRCGLDDSEVDQSVLVPVRVGEDEWVLEEAWEEANTAPEQAWEEYDDWASATGFDPLNLMKSYMPREWL